MDIYAYLKKDHRKVEDLLSKVVKATQAKRQQLFLDIHKELELHSDPEKETFYKAIKKHGKKAKEEAEHGSDEHEDIKKALKKVATTKDKDQWLIYFGELKKIVEHHIEEEEDDIFPEAKKILSAKQAKQLAIDMDALKEKKKASKKFEKMFVR